MNLITKKTLEERLERTRQRYARQQERLEMLQRSMQNNEENIIQMEYALEMMERVCKQHRRHRVISNAEVEEFFIHASNVYDRLQHRLHMHLNYTYFCCVISSRYLFESRLHTPNRRFISPATVLSYFKRERGR
ncbi:hypothetical protein [Bacteroides timonensis]|uniref:hypothetical protein n=1 Tax=Bacteroides timonensis TaxID=1470345 RepID=UPI0004BB4481|nr:hypothetical protein [Bacteroides timonensis]